MFALIGLGNPGRQYAKSPHNAGFLCIDEICERWDVCLTRMGKMVEAKVVDWEGKRVMLAKPHTYMNLSGTAVRWIADYYKIDFSQIVVVYDDIDLPMGTIRIRESGSAGTHKGMKSIVQHLGVKDFPRIRIGIRPAGEEAQADLVSYVLSPVSRRERGLFQEGIHQATMAAEAIFHYDVKKAMNEFNRRTSPCF